MTSRKETSLSLMERIAFLDPPERTEAILKVAPTEEERNLLRYRWPIWARPNQLPPSDREWFTWFIHSGRGSGKTRTGSEWIIQRARDGHGPIALVGQTKADVRDTMVELGESAIMNVVEPGFRPAYEPSKRRLTFPNGVVCTIFSGDEPDQLRGPQHATIWMDELAKFKYPKEAHSNAVLGLRVGEDPRMLITTTPRPIETIKRIIADPMTAAVTGSTYDNLSNLSPVFIREITKLYGGTKLGLQELEGRLLEDTEGALWTLGNIEENRARQLPDLVRVGVGVDPKASTNANSETGIVAAGLGIDGHGYILGDYSIDGPPAKWAAEVLSAYTIHQADVVIAEVNNGGDMVSHVIQTMRDDQDRPIGANVPIYPVHASRGKATRAEPISNLYQQGRVHHAGSFSGLEDQLCTWIPGVSNSPDRLDALVWVLSALMLPQPLKKSGRKRKRKRLRYKR